MSDRTDRVEQQRQERAEKARTTQAQFMLVPAANLTTNGQVFACRACGSVVYQALMQAHVDFHDGR